MKVWLAHPTEVDAIWPTVKDGLAKALARCGGDMTIGHLYGQCASGSARLLVAMEEGNPIGACACRYELWETGPKLRVLAMYGETFAEWQDDGWKAVHALKDAYGAEAIIFEGRLGWGRKLPGAKVLRALYEVS